MVKRSNKAMQTDNDKNMSKKCKLSVNSALGVFNTLKNSNNRNKLIGIMSLFVLSICLTLLLTGKAYAAKTDWNGFVVDSTYSQNDKRGFFTGYFTVNLFKNWSRYSTNTERATAVAQKTNASKTQWNYNLNIEKKGSQQFKLDCTTCDANNIYITPGTYVTSNIRANGSYHPDNPNQYAYLFAPIKIKIPKGYKYNANDVGYASWYYTTPSYFGIYNTNVVKYGYENKGLWDPSVGKRGPYASDTWVSGYVNIAESAMGAVTREGDNNGSHAEVRSFQSHSINFMPNTTTITFNANGGSGSMPNKIKTYDSTLSVNNEFTRNGYIFAGWNTKADGTGTTYGTTLDKQIWPTESSITLYAKWISSDSSCENLNGFTYQSVGGEYGYNSGYFCMHMAKNGTLFSSDKVSVTPKITGTNGTTDLANTHVFNNSQRWKFSNSDTSNIKVADSSNPSKEYAGNKINNVGYVGSGNWFIYPELSLKIPRGYKYGNTNLGGYIPYNHDLFPDSYELYGVKSNQPAANTTLDLLFKNESDRGPYDTDTWKSGYLAIHVKSMGVYSVDNSSSNYYRIFNSNNLNFLPNETKVHYDGNGGTIDAGDEGGTMTMEDSMHTYDEESYLSSNVYTKVDSVFDKWCTQANGGGKCYSENERVTTEFPTESEVTLYAQWKPHYSATIYYQSNSTSGETDIDIINDLSCIVESGTSCTVTIPDKVRSSVGTHNNKYAGLASSAGTMSTSIGADATTITLSSSKAYYAVYRTNVINYYYGY